MSCTEFSPPVDRVEPSELPLILWTRDQPSDTALAFSATNNMMEIVQAQGKKATFILQCPLAPPTRRSRSVSRLVALLYSSRAAFYVLQLDVFFISLTSKLVALMTHRTLCRERRMTVCSIAAPEREAPTQGDALDNAMIWSHCWRQ